MHVLLIFAWFNWKTIKTDNFTVIYQPDYDWEATQTLYNLEYYKDDIWKLTGNRYRTLPIVIEDVGNLTNGYADPVFRNVHIFTYPPNPGLSFNSTLNWYRLVGIHEYTHICHLTRLSGLSKVFNFIFGFIFMPNLYSPLWLIEGTAVYAESKNFYEGRLNDGFFDSYIAARKDDFPSILEITFTPLEYPYYMGPYLYGSEFVNFITRKYGEKKLTGFFDTYGNFIWAPIGIIFPAVGIDFAALSTYSRSFPSLHREWKKSVKIKYHDWKIDGKRITNDGWSKSYLSNHNGKLYYYKEHLLKTDANRARSYHYIIELDNAKGFEKIVADLMTPVIAPFRFENGTLYYMINSIQKGYANVNYLRFGYTSTIYKVDLKTLKREKLCTDAIRGFAVLPDGSIIYSKDRAHNFGSEIWVYASGTKSKIWETDYLIGEIAIAGNKVAVTAREDYEAWGVYLLDLECEEFVPVTDTPWVAANISLQDNKLIYTMNNGGIYSIHYYDFTDDQNYILTNGGYANYGAIEDSMVYFIGINKDGLDLYKKRFEPEVFYPGADLIRATKPDFENIDIEISHGGYFDVFKTLFQPPLRLPIPLPADSTFDKIILGFLLLGGDATSENIYITAFGYDHFNDDVFFDGIVSSRFFAPIQFDFEYLHSSWDDYVTLGLNYPFYKSLNPGISQFSLFVNGMASGDDYSRKEINPGFSTGFQNTNLKTELSFGLHLERENLGSTVNRTAEEFALRTRYYLAGGEFRSLIGGFHDPDNPDSTYIVIRGNDLYTETGGKVMIEYAHPLWKIRRGMWNPNVYFEDLIGTVFFDVGFSKDSEFIWSAGVDLSAETGIAFGYIRLSPGVSFAFTNERDLKFDLSIL